LEDLQRVIAQNKAGTSGLYLRNLLKETLQIYTLNFIYSSNWGKSFLFKGGTCLRFCFDLPRLSEDLDFDIINYSDFNLEAFLTDLKQYFQSKWQVEDFSIKVAGNNRQIFLQFPLLQKLGLAGPNDSNILFLRLDLSPTDSEIYTEEISVKTTQNLSFIMKRYSLPDLFASKIAAILQRSFRKGKDDIITFKGRDYFDLIWFMEKKVVPNFKRLQDLTRYDQKTVINLLEEKVGQVKVNFLAEDLNPLFRDGKFVDDFCQNFQTLASQYPPHILPSRRKAGIKVFQ